MRRARWTRQLDNQQKDRTYGRGVGVNPSRRDWRLVAAGVVVVVVVVVLVALVVVGRLQPDIGDPTTHAPRSAWR
jgi:hypothetical protein